MCEDKYSRNLQQTSQRSVEGLLRHDNKQSVVNSFVLYVINIILQDSVMTRISERKKTKWFSIKIIKGTLHKLQKKVVESSFHFDLFVFVV